MVIFVKEFNFFNVIIKSKTEHTLVLVSEINSENYQSSFNSAYQVDLIFLTFFVLSSVL